MYSFTAPARVGQFTSTFRAASLIVNATGPREGTGGGPGKQEFRASCNAANAGASIVRTGQGSSHMGKTRRPASGGEFLLLARPKLVAVFSSFWPKIRSYGRRA